ncbi:glycosyltransferase [Hyunsoonleella pacifica]|uniref:Glycosyltransferase n=1 Tax=Hyunsoonleella pacifica TaxID=1080224 RepID=A0A4Q9FKC2_9FLAO|nr:glycosyltransferase [Hyunsoonleella pacifica]TBN13852.1 glycosyltransferase [Hyunsoonleella pacifica]GGD26237.1 glycosyl transferase family 2 [Hyunsoonleella pacifica]
MIILDIALYALIIVVLIQVFFFLHIFGKFAFSKSKNVTNTSKTSVSVIICAKNEADNLSSFLPYIIEQEYEDFEIVLINDASKDNTLEVMKTFSEAHQNIKIVDVEPVETFWGNKKYPLTLGIKAAKHNVLLFTDADCKPLSKYWIKDMVSNFNSQTSIVLGYGAYSKVKNSLINKLIRFETLHAAMCYLSFAKLGMPYMGVGRNLAYTKRQFFEVNGFMKHMRIRSGDDDLFVNEAATSDNTSICVTANSFTTSKPKTSLKTWFKQKRRHVSTAKHYKLNHKITLGLLYISCLLFWILSITLLAFWHLPILVGALVLTRIIVIIATYGFSAKKLREKDLILLSPFLEIFLIIAQLAIFINNIISKPNYWK